MDISEGEIHESPRINAYGSLVAGELSGEGEDIDVTGEVRNFRKITYTLAFVGVYMDSKTRKRKQNEGNNVFVFYRRKMLSTGHYARARDNATVQREGERARVKQPN